MKVLLIEDSPDIEKTLRLTFSLRWSESTIVSTDKGSVGVEMAKTESPDVILLDINLPDMTGFEVMKQVRLFSNVPIIVLTVREDEEDRSRAFETGANDYVTKPFSPLDLVSRVREVLRQTI